MIVKHNDIDFNTKPSAMVATKRPAQHQPMSNRTNVDQTLTGYFASMAPPAPLKTNSPQKKKWKKY